ncbi:MAG: glycosyltransferase family 39 protein [Burkholderiaceae bacterium]|nr:glycosyltransferase family 39 protein [Roseateles sp.]MBV8468985.1 glycosyltransferase family 39 protein [Burkholderiaceae bacterium]
MRIHKHSIFLLSAALLLATLLLRPINIPDEARYLSVSVGMWNSGHWWVPTLDGMPYFHKPPLFYWLTGLVYGLSGGCIEAARLVSWAAGLCAMGVLAATMRRHLQHGEQAANWALLFLASVPLWYLGSQYANLDMLVASCISMAVCLLASDLMAPHLRWRIAGYLMMGLGTMAKGLIGFVLPMLVLAPWALWCLGWRSALRLAWIPGWLLVLGVCAPWFTVMESEFPGFAHYFFILHHVQRFASGGFNNVMPWPFYIAVLLVLNLPWTPTLLWLSAKPSQARETGDAARHLQRLALCWVGAITLFFSLPASKLLGYILPVVPGLALAIGPALARQASQGSRWPRALVVLGSVICVAMIFGMNMDGGKSNHTLIKAVAQEWRPGDALVFDNSFTFDVPLMLRLPPPTPVFLDHPMEPQKQDSWRRELVEAAEFAPAQGAKALRPVSDWAQVRCAAPRTWIVYDIQAPMLLTERKGLPVIGRSDRFEAVLFQAPADCKRPQP